MLPSVNIMTFCASKRVYAIPKFNGSFCDFINYYFMKTLRLSPNTGVDQLFSRRATFEKILKSRAALIGRAKKKHPKA